MGMDEFVLIQSHLNMPITDSLKLGLSHKVFNKIMLLNYVSKKYRILYSKIFLQIPLLEFNFEFIISNMHLSKILINKYYITPIFFNHFITLIRKYVYSNENLVSLNLKTIARS